jgi:hypothetical protein
MANGQNGSNSSPPAFSAVTAIAQLDQIRASVPNFRPADPKIRRSITRKAAFPNEYIEAAADIMQASEDIGRAAQFDAATARSGLALSGEIRALIKEAETFLDGLRFTDAELRASLVDGCDRVYALAPGVARVDRSLTPHIEAMHHASRRKGGKKKASGTPTPAPAPPPVH